MKPFAGKTLLAAAAVAGLLLLGAPAASAQTAVDQYNPSPLVAGSPTLDDAGVLVSGAIKGAKASGGRNRPNGGVAGVAASGGSGGGLPFTGYPMTPLLWAIAALLVLGLALRTIAPRLDRRRA